MKTNQDIAEKLKFYRAKVVAAAALNKEFGNFIGIELFDYIQSQPTLKDEVNNRTKYLNILSEDVELVELQNHLVKLISQVLTTIDAEDVQRGQTGWNNSLYVIFKCHQGFADLTRLYGILRTKDCYYRLGDSAPHVSGDTDIPFTHSTAAIRQQYTVFDRFLELLGHYGALETRLESEPTAGLLREFYTVRHRFNELTHAMPIKLHVESFIDFFYFSVSVYSRSGYEHWHDFLHSALYEQNGVYKFEKIKNASLTVIDDLLDLMDISSMDVAKDVTRVFSLFKNGKLERIIGDTVQTYVMDSNSLRYRIVKKLADSSRHTYCDTDDLAATLGAKPGEVRKCIGDIKVQIKKNFPGLEGSDFIESKKNSGYKLNSAVRIIKES